MEGMVALSFLCCRSKNTKNNIIINIKNNTIDSNNIMLEVQPGMAASVKSLMPKTVNNPATAITSKTANMRNMRIQTSSMNTEIMLKLWSTRLVKLIFDFPV